MVIWILREADNSVVKQYLSLTFSAYFSFLHTAGDHKDTAIAIGGMLGLVDSKYSGALTGTELDGMDDKQVREAVMNHNIFARASPQNKIQIVEALQAEKQISSMTGTFPSDKL